MEKASLSNLERKIYFAARGARGGVIPMETISSWNFASSGTLRVVLSRMCKKGWLRKLKRGVYLVGEPGKAALEDQFFIATRLFGGYLAFSSALYVHKLTDQYPFGVFVATRNKFGQKRFGEVTINAIGIGKRAYGASFTPAGYFVSTVPKTLYDCLVHPEEAGGYPAILKAFYDARMKEPEWEEFFSYANKFERAAFFQRLGYLLSLLPRKDALVKKTIKLCKAKVRAVIYLFGKSHGEYVLEWKLVDNVGKDALLGWWY